jgi:hypothetical protein
MITVEMLVDLLDEHAPAGVATLERAVRMLDEDTLQYVLQSTQAVEAAGGLLVHAKTRRRTPGGVFFWLLKQHLYETGQHTALAQVFPPPRRLVARRERTPAAPTAEAPIAPVRRRLRGIATPLPRRQRQASGGRKGRARPNQAVITQIIDTYLPPSTGLYRRSIDSESGAVTLAFAFPAVAVRQHADAIRLVGLLARVPISVSPHVHQGRLTDAARDVLGEQAANAKVAVHEAQQSVLVTLAVPLELSALLAAIAAFYDHTGWTLAVLGPLSNEEGPGAG